MTNWKIKSFKNLQTMGNCLSGCLSVATCGLCGPRKNSKSRRSRDAREPLLGQGRGQNGTPTLTDGPVTAMAGPSRGERKPPNTTNILGFGMRDVNEDYILGDVLGEGAFGTVRRCRHRRDASEYACKTVLKEQLKRRADVEDVRREVQILWVREHASSPF